MKNLNKNIILKFLCAVHLLLCHVHGSDLGDQENQNPNIPATINQRRKRPREEPGYDYKNLKEYLTDTLLYNEDRQATLELCRQGGFSLFELEYELDLVCQKDDADMAEALLKHCIDDARTVKDYKNKIFLNGFKYNFENIDEYNIVNKFFKELEIKLNNNNEILEIISLIIKHRVPGIVQQLLDHSYDDEQTKIILWEKFLELSYTKDHHDFIESYFTQYKGMTHTYENASKFVKLACFNGKYETAAIILNFYPDLISIENQDGQTLLHMVCNREEIPDNAEYKKAFLKYFFSKDDEVKSKNLIGIDFKKKDKYGHAALHYSAFKNNIDDIKILLEKNPDLINMKNKHKHTALIIACAQKNNQIIEHLLHKGADPKILDASCHTALHYCCEKNNFDAIKMLLTKDPTLINMRNYRNQTALTFACRAVNFDIVQYLYNKGADLNIIDTDENTLLHHCCLTNNLEAAKFVLSKNHHLINRQNKYGRTALMCALKQTNVQSNLALIKYLVDEGADLFAKDKKGVNCFNYIKNSTASSNIKMSINEMIENRKIVPALPSVESIISHVDISDVD